MKKGMTGKILTIIISLVLGIMALAILWIFLTRSTTIINESVQKALTGIKCKIFCEGFIGSVNNFLGVMCKGC